MQPFTVQDAVEQLLKNADLSKAIATGLVVLTATMIFNQLFQMTRLMVRAALADSLRRNLDPDEPPPPNDDDSEDDYHNPYAETSE